MHDTNKKFKFKLYIMHLTMKMYINLVYKRLINYFNYLLFDMINPKYYNYQYNHYYYVEET